jgi:Sigma-70 region 3
MMESISKVVRKSRQMLNEIGREPPEELAEKLGMPFEKVREVLKIAKTRVERRAGSAVSSPGPSTRRLFFGGGVEHRDETAWLGMSDSNSEMSSQIIPLKGRTDFRESGRILATETIRV